MLQNSSSSSLTKLTVRMLRLQYWFSAGRGLARVRSLRRAAGQNPGFMAQLQLQLWEDMQWRLDKSCTRCKMFRLHIINTKSYGCLACLHYPDLGQGADPQVTDAVVRRGGAPAGSTPPPPLPPALCTGASCATAASPPAAASCHTRRWRGAADNIHGGPLGQHVGHGS